METVRVLNIEIRNIGFQQFLEGLREGAVFTPNVDHLMKLQRDRAFYEAYRQAEHVVCDSRVVQLASRFLFPGRGIVEQIAGSDLLPAWCRMPQTSLFLLGGTAESLAAARESLNRTAGRAAVVDGYSPPFGFEHDEVETARIVDRVNRSGATSLAVGVGAPKQELWIQQHRTRMPGVRVFLAIGAAIDFAGRGQRRAPRWMRQAGLEWLYRMAREPGRLVKRYLWDDLPFFSLVLKQRLGSYRDPWGPAGDGMK